MKTVPEMLEVLHAQGYIGHEEVNVWERGLTHSVRKQTVSGTWLHFSFWADNTGGPNFWVGELRHHFQLADSKWWIPSMLCAIEPIFEEHLVLLPEFEKRVCRPEYSKLPQLLLIENEMIKQREKENK